MEQITENKKPVVTKEQKQKYNKTSYEKHKEKYKQNEKKKYYIKHLGLEKVNEILEQNDNNLSLSIPQLKYEKQIITFKNKYPNLTIS
jgi:hypothetical protein